jgi:translocation and assembly module TamA
LVGFIAALGKTTASRLRGQIRSILGADAADVPASYLFYSGGVALSVDSRINPLAVDLSGGNEIGGTSFSRNLRRAWMSLPLALSGFTAYRFVGADAIPFENGDWHAGAGLGLRCSTGISPIG